MTKLYVIISTIILLVLLVFSPVVSTISWTGGPGTWSGGPGTWSGGPGTWSGGPGTWSGGPGTWSG